MTFIDLVLIVIYLGISVYLGTRGSGKREKTVLAYFTDRGGGKGIFYQMMVGFSIMATFFSGLSFTMYPSIVYSEGIMILWGLAIFPISWVLLYFWFWPAYLSRKPLLPYDLIEERYGYGIRSYTSVLFFCLRVGWMSSLIYVPAIIIMASAQLSHAWLWPIVITVGVTCTLYTTVGGIRGVIVTDALQFLVMFTGILWLCLYIFFNLPLSPMSAFQDLHDEGFLVIRDFHFSWTDTITFWSIIIGFLIPNIAAYIGDPMSLQRYISLETRQANNRSFACNLAGVVTIILLLILVGLLLHAWYRFQGDPDLPGDPDFVFPYFVSTQLPPGLAGLLVAAILAATMSSLTSGINALAGALTNDFRARTRRKYSDEELLRFGKRASVIIGLSATFFAGLVENLGSLFDITRKLLGVFAGPMAAPMLLSILRIPCRKYSIVAGGVTGLCFGWILAFSPLSSLWVAPAAMMSAMGIPLFDGLWTGLTSRAKKRESLTGDGKEDSP